MKRRFFLKNSAPALFGFTVLPPAETYQRIWKAQRAFNPAEYEGAFKVINIPDRVEPGIIINDAYFSTIYERSFLMSQETLDEWKRSILPRTLDISRFKA